MSSANASVIIAAAGLGNRLAGNTNNTPKQFTELGSIPIFIWSLTTFLEHSKIQQAILVVPESWLDKTKELLAKHLSKYSKQIKVIPGGSSRQESVHLALETIALEQEQPSYIVIHDAARPFVTSSYIDKVINTLEKGFACTLAILSSDSIRKVKNDSVIQELDRNNLALMQTPQGADFIQMLKAHRQAQKNGHATTDDAALIQNYGVQTKIIESSRLNLKITQADDMLIAKALVDTYGWRPGNINYSSCKKD